MIPSKHLQALKDGLNNPQCPLTTVLSKECVLISKPLTIEAYETGKMSNKRHLLYVFQGRENGAEGGSRTELTILSGQEVRSF